MGEASRWPGWVDRYEVLQLVGDRLRASKARIGYEIDFDRNRSEHVTQLLRGGRAWVRALPGIEIERENQFVPHPGATSRSHGQETNVVGQRRQGSARTPQRLAMS